MHTRIVASGCCLQAVLLYAKACDSLPLLQCQTNATAMLEAMRGTSFTGKSGLVKLDENEDLIPGVQVYLRVCVRACVNSGRACACARARVCDKRVPNLGVYLCVHWCLGVGVRAHPSKVVCVRAHARVYVVGTQTNHTKKG